MTEHEKTRRNIAIFYLGTFLMFAIWGLSLSAQITEMGRALTYALNARQVVVVPHHAIMGDEAPTPVSGP